MVRVGYEDEAQVRGLASWMDHFAVYRDKGVVLMQVEAAELERLLAAGYRVEVDAARTAVIERARAAREVAGEGVAGIPGFPCYRTVEETFATAEALAADHPELAAWLDVGDSWEKTALPGEGYDVRVLVLTNTAVAGPKPALLVNSALHSREYTTAELNTRFAEYLVAGYGSDPDLTWLLDHHQVHLLLVHNPDGRKRAEQGLSWRKNADDDYCTGTNSRGADLNRNFDFQWGCCGGSSPFECDPTYRGPAAGSEPETEAIQAYARALFPDQRPDDLVTPAPDDSTGVVLDLHSFGEDVLWSWGFNDDDPPNAAQLWTLGRKYAFFAGYFPFQGSFGTVDGSTKDFAYGELGVPGYTIELGTAFFEGCGYFESVVLPDNLESLLYAAKVARTPYLTPAGPDVVSPSIPAVAFPQGTPAPLTGVADDTRYSDANGIEPVQPVAAAEYYVDLAPWQGGAVGLPMSAADGVFDEAVEAVEASVDTTVLAAGRRQLFVRARDADGNWGAVSGAFLWVLDPATAATVEGFVRDRDSGAPLEAEVTVGPFAAATDPGTGFYSLTLPGGTYEGAATSAGHAAVTVGGVVAGDSQTVSLDFDLPPLVAVLADDVEGGNAGWTAEPPWAITDETAFSPTHSWTDSPGGDYAANTDAALVSPPLDFGGLVGVGLSFRHLYDLERGFDFARVEVSADGGATWTEAALFSDAGQTAEWALAEIPLTQLDGVADARVRFRLESDGSVQADGWHLDDLLLAGHLPGPPALIFADGFESGDLSSWAAAVP